MGGNKGRLSFGVIFGILLEMRLADAAELVSMVNVSLEVYYEA